MLVCRTCGFENPAGHKFCGECGARLDVSGPVGGQERKTVSVLFCDLVGFTAASDGADPEEVQAALSPYYARVRLEVERFGGTVEKFIGDAVMAAFGAPVVHEDDPERAVRAGLALLSAVADLKRTDGLDLAVRVGIATGETVVSTGARPERGEGMLAGDVVNTAARLQTAAPVGSVLVGQETRDATGATIEYLAHDRVTVKGKAEPLPVWVAVRPRGSPGEALTDTSHPMIGRGEALSALQRAYARALRESSVQQVTIVAEAGLGKSRLVQAFSDWVDDREELVCWRQGSCPSYGAATFAPVAQVVKAQTGILDSDDASRTAAKLTETVHALLRGTGAASEESWLVARLAPLVGLPALESPREELFTAWRRFLEALAATSPLVLIVEDLHWADPATLEFLSYLLDQVADVPLLIVATTRPKLPDTAAGWSNGRHSSITLTLDPLSDAETAQLVTSLLGTTVLPADVHAALLARAAGNPLYTREYLNLVIGHGEQPGSAADLSTALPGSVQAVIAARLDALPAESKRLLQAAAVIGPTFWTGAVAALTDGDSKVVTRRLHDLVQRDYVRASRASTVAGETEYAFSHALIADVAYNQLPRLQRLAHHRSAGDWHVAVASAAQSPSGAQDAVIAHHYTSAHTMAVAARGDPGGLAELAALAATWHARAARQAQQVDLAAAETHLRASLELTSPGHRDRLSVLVLLGEVLTNAGRAGDADLVYRQAHDLAEAIGDRVGVALVDVNRANALTALARFADAAELIDGAVSILEHEPAGPELLHAYVALASRLTVEGLYVQARDRSDQALALAERLADPPPRQVARALLCRGVSRSWSGDAAGEDDLLRALDLTSTRNLTAGLITTSGEIGLLKLMTDSPDAAIPFSERAVALATDRGHRAAVLFNSGNLAEALALAGRIDDALAVCERGARAIGETDSPRQAMALQLYWSWILTIRGEFKEAERLVDKALPVARGVEPSALVEVLLVAVDCARGRRDSAGVAALTDELVATLGSPEVDADLGQDLRLLARALGPAGHSDLIARILDHTPPGMLFYDNNVLSARAVLAESAGDYPASRALYGQAGAAWATYRCPLEHAQALLGDARCCLALGDSAAEALIGGTRNTHEPGGSTASRRGSHPAESCGRTPRCRRHSRIAHTGGSENHSCVAGRRCCNGSCASTCTSRPTWIPGPQNVLPCCRTLPRQWTHPTSRRSPPSTSD